MSLSKNSQSKNGWVGELENSINGLTLRKFEYSDFEDIETIGIGGFGKVYKASSKSIKKIVAIKKVKIFDETSANIFINELKLHQDVDFDDNILRLYGISKKYPQKTEYLMVIEHADGTLRQYLKENFISLNWNDKLRMAKQITSAVIYLHEKDIIHRDLHPGNILIRDGSIKLSDFGLSKKLRDASNTQTTSAPIGVIPYIDPLCFKITNKGSYYKKTRKSDIYSLGVVLWELISGYPPFDSAEKGYELVFQILSGRRETNIEGTPQGYIDIYEACWDENPDKRPEIIRVKELLDSLDTNIESDTSKIPNELELYKSENLISNIKNLMIASNIVKELEINTLNELYQLIFDKMSKGHLTSELPSYINKFIEDNQTISEQIFNLLINCQEIPQNAVTLGIFYESGIGTTRNNKKAFQCFLQSADVDHLGKWFLGYCFESGTGTTTDHKKAFQWFLKSAEGGNIAGQCSIGYYFRDGIGTTMNYKKAFQWYLKSAEGGNDLGKCSLGYCYEKGIGTTQDYDKAFQWYLKSAEGGNNMGQCSLGYSYENGIGTTQDYNKAFQWYLKSAEGGNRQGQNNLGICYRNGIGTMKNEEKAKYWIYRSRG